MVILDECCFCVGLKRGSFCIGCVYLFLMCLNILNRVFSRVDTPMHNATSLMYAVVCAIIAFLVLYGSWEYNSSLLSEAAVMMWVSGVMFWISFIVEMASYIDDEEEIKEVNSSMAKTMMFLVSVLCSFIVYVAIHVYFPLVIWSYGHIYYS
jgi:hypothetical protein